MKYSIDIASRKTGLPKNLIRAWELRYSILEPDRTDSNRRLYSEDDIERLRLLADVRKLGYKISMVAMLSNQDLIKILEENAIEPLDTAIDNSTDEIRHDTYYNVINDIQKLVECYDEHGVKELLNNLRIQYSKPDIINKIIMPFMNQVGLRWKSGKMRISHEHFVTSIIGNFLSNIRESDPRYQLSKKVLICTPSGQHHEVGALAASVLISEAGYKVVYIGSNTPTEEIAASFVQSSADAIAISIIIPENDSFLLTEMRRLREYIKQAPIIVGGNINVSFGEKLTSQGITFLNDINQIVPFLDKLLMNND